MTREVRSSVPERINDASLKTQRPTLWGSALSAWRSPLVFALGLIAVAVVLAAFYRFHSLIR
jgi:hypothetical protein